MSKAFEIHVKVELSLEQMTDGPATYIERFRIPLNGELDAGEVLAASIAMIASFQASMRKVGWSVREAGRMAERMQPGTLGGQQFAAGNVTPPDPAE